MNKQPKDQGNREAIAIAIVNARKTLQANSRTESAVSDMLTDLRHYCHALDVDFYECLDTSYQDYFAERHGSQKALI
jgi:hypothetical protein